MTALAPAFLSDTELRRRAVADLEGPVRKLYFDMALRIGRLHVQHETKIRAGKLVTKEHFWTTPDGKKRSPKTAAALIASGALEPCEDGLLDGLAQNYRRDGRP